MLSEFTVKTEDHDYLGLSLRLIYGLNVFIANDVPKDITHDPRAMFLASLSEQFSCIAHAGSMALKDIFDASETVFRLNPSEAYKKTDVSLWGGEFFQDEKRDSFFVNQPGEGFWTAETADNKSVIDYLFRCDALALYVQPRNQTLCPPVQFPEIEFQDHKDWIISFLKSYSLVVLTGYDGWHIELYASRPVDFDLASVALAKAQEGIRTSPWYLQNKDRLFWDEEDSCLKLRA